MKYQKNSLFKKIKTHRNKRNKLHFPQIKFNK